VKNSLLLAVSAIGVLWAGTLFGQGGVAPVRPAAPAPAPARAAGGQNVALLDVSYLFEKLPHFKAYMQQVTDDAQKAQDEVKREEQEIKKLAESAEAVRGTPKFKAIEEEITRRRGDLAVKIELQRRNFQQRQAKIYLSVYKEVQDQASLVCSQYGYDIVLRFNGDPVDAENPQSVLTYINRPVVWYAEQRDITPFVLKSITSRREPVPGGVSERPRGLPIPK